MERNWLIRTSQDQILGPVAKAKVIEFIEKGALGLNDEVTSGNGYWFSLKEKDLIEKYLYGDIPQGYNPISESKSVLSKRDNPDKTTSLNSAPANSASNNLSKVSPTTVPGVVPPKADLEYPDITVIRQTAPANLDVDLKLPPSEDLEFPDIAKIKASVEATPVIAIHKAEVSKPSITTSPPPASKSGISVGVQNNEEMIYPDEDDLAFPEIEKTHNSVPSFNPDILDNEDDQEEDREFSVPVKKSSVEELQSDFDSDSGLTLVMNMGEINAQLNPQSAPAPTPVATPVATPATSQSVVHSHAKAEVFPNEPALGLVKKKEKLANGGPRAQHDLYEEKKLLHDRKEKKSTHADSQQHDSAVRTIPPELKKRNDNYLLYVLVILVLIILSLFFYYYRNILNKPLPV